MDFKQYEEVMKKIKDDSAALETKLTDPEFKKFYDADIEKRND